MAWREKEHNKSEKKREKPEQVSEREEEIVLTKKVKKNEKWTRDNGDGDDDGFESIAAVMKQSRLCQTQKQ